MKKANSGWGWPHQVKTNSEEEPEGKADVDWDEDGEEQEEGAQTLKKNKIILLKIDAWTENIFGTQEIMKLFLYGRRLVTDLEEKQNNLLIRRSTRKCFWHL